jgi:dynein heavy chain
MQALVYLTGECNYGGRVTDAHDRRTLVSILSVIYQPNILHDSYRLSNSGAYLVPEDCEYQEYIEHIKRFPLIAMPEAFGLHQNADITKDNQEVNQLLTAILSTQVLLLAPLNPDSALCPAPSSPQNASALWDIDPCYSPSCYGI